MSAEPTSPGSPALVILAGGASSRLGRCKALVPIGGRTVLERLLEAGEGLFEGSPPEPFEPPLLVAGAHVDELRDAAPPGVEVVHNAGWAAGRTGSVPHAVRARPGRDLCIAPVDVPLVPRATFARLAADWRRLGAPARGWLAPRFQNSGESPQFGHPVLVGRELAREICTFEANQPLKHLRARSSPLAAVEVDTPEVLDDLDTPEDLARLRRRVGNL